MGIEVGANDVNRRTLEPPVVELLSLTYTTPVLSTHTPAGPLTAVLVAIPDSTSPFTPAPVPKKVDIIPILLIIRARRLPKSATKTLPAVSTDKPAG